MVDLPPSHPDAAQNAHGIQLQQEEEIKHLIDNGYRESTHQLSYQLSYKLSYQFKYQLSYQLEPHWCKHRCKYIQDTQ